MSLALNICPPVFSTHKVSCYVIQNSFWETLQRDIECLCQMNILLRVSRSDILSVASLGRKVSSESSYERKCLVLCCTDSCALQTTDFQYTSNTHTNPLLQLCHWLNSALLQTGPGYTREVLSFINLSIILVQFYNMQGPLTVPYQGHSNDETLRKSKPTKKKTQMSLQKRGTLQKRRQEVLVFNTTGVLQGEDKQKYTTTKEVPGLIYKQPLKRLWGNFIKTRCVPLRPKTGTESKTKKSAIYLREC